MHYNFEAEKRLLRNQTTIGFERVGLLYHLPKEINNEKGF